MTELRYRLLGRTGLRVSELCLGAMTFSGREEAAKAVSRFADAGGNFIDTANRYGRGESERIVGEVLKGDRDRWVLASKYALSTDHADPNAGGAHRKSLRRAIDDSLTRLQTDYLDLYWVHVWDTFTQVEELVHALDELVRSGKVLYVGISDAPAWLVSRAVTMAEERRLSAFAALQIPYSLVERTVEHELLPMAKGLDLAVTSWAPVGGGLLTGRYGSDRERPTEGRWAQRDISARRLAIADALNVVADARGVPATQVAIAWVLAQQRRAEIIPILGVRTAAHIEDNLAAADLELTSDELQRLDEVSAVRPVFPHGFGEGLAHGDLLDRVRDHRGRIDPIL